ncbi:hypothetical protein [Limnobacter alexandrii]|jgi:hypothetical protein|uniref:hypothetical protein n=1 Tax=Limnobacter alexandrii TaxID=2570352 RepID=UPI0011085220|nr:hypothetical protein [Limnobacter alexandrii]
MKLSATHNPNAIIAATFSLMSAWAQSSLDPHHPASKSRHLLIRKIINNLNLLKQHSEIDSNFCAVVANIEKSWKDIGQACGMECDCFTHSLLH